MLQLPTLPHLVTWGFLLSRPSVQVGFFLVEDAVQRQAGGAGGQGLDVVAQVRGALASCLWVVCALFCT